MQYALVDNRMVEATPQARGVCPLCRATVIAKCGSQKVHHWAHANATDCDTWAEPEGVWHRGWKKLVHLSYREVVLPPHRADIRFPNGQVIELQASPISIEEIQEREQFYRTMIWVVDASDFWLNFDVFHKYSYIPWKFDDPDNSLFIWKYARKCWYACKAPVFFDTPAGLFYCRFFAGYRNTYGQVCKAMHQLQRVSKHTVLQQCFQFTSVIS